MKKDFVAIMMLTFVNMLGFTILFPVLPFIVESFGLSELYYGVLLSCYAFFQFIAAPVLGNLSDRHGRKPLLIVSQFGTMMSWVIFGVAYFLPETRLLRLPLAFLVIAFSRITDGITGGNISIANAYISDITKPKDRTHAFGILGAVMGLALIIGPAIGGYSGSTQYGYLGTVIVAFLISLITLVCLQLFLKESLKHEHRNTDKKEHLFTQINIFSKIWKFRHNKELINVIQLRSGFGLVFSSYVSIVALFVIDVFSFNQRELGNFLFFIGTFIIFNQAILVKRFVRWIGEYRSMILSQILFSAGLLLLTSTDDFILFISYYYFMNLGISLAMPTFKSQLAKHVSEKKQGMIMGIDESLNAFFNAISPIIAGAIYAAIGIRSLWLMSCLVVASLVLFFASRRSS